MPLPINIEELIYQRTVERTRIEYKRDWNPEPIVHSITAFANDFDNMGGGYIIIGIEEENGRPLFPIKGLEANSLDFIQQDLLNKCNFIEPRYVPVVEPYLINGKDILVLWISGGENRPYRCPEMIYTKKSTQKSEKVYYIRKASRTMKANHLEERELISMSNDVPFDDRINYHANVSDIRFALMTDFLYVVGSSLYQRIMDSSVEAIATNMRLVRGPSEYKKPLNVALMFFNEKPDNYFPYARIEIVDKPDPTGIGMTEKIFTGPLDKQLKDALAYIKNYVIKEYITKIQGQAEAIRVFNWPYQAIKEALSNAIYHKSYQIHEPITVTITPDKMEILSLPGPDRSITDEDLRNRVLISRRYRNRRIGDFLKELKIVEGRNTGVPLIVNAMNNNGSDLPFFITDEDRSYFLVILPIHKVFLNVEEKNISKSRTDRNKLRELILEILMENGHLSMNQIANLLGYSKLTNTIRGVVKEMLDKNDVTYLYPDKPKSSKQKICLLNNRKFKS